MKAVTKPVDATIDSDGGHGKVCERTRRASLRGDAESSEETRWNVSAPEDRDIARS